MATKGFPGSFQGGLTTGYRMIGAVLNLKNTASKGFPGAFQGGLSTGYRTIGAVQTQYVAPSVTTFLSRLTLMGVG